MQLGQLKKKKKLQMNIIWFENKSARGFGDECLEDYSLFVELYQEAANYDTCPTSLGLGPGDALPCLETLAKASGS